MCHYTSAQAFCSQQGFKDNYDGIIFCLLPIATWMWNDLIHEDAMGENETRVNKWHGEVLNETCSSHQMRQNITIPCSDGCDISFNKCNVRIRCFYGKRLAVHSKYFLLLQYACVAWESNPSTSTRATGDRNLHSRIFILHRELNYRSSFKVHMFIWVSKLPFKHFQRNHHKWKLHHPLSSSVLLLCPLKIFNNPPHINKSILQL